MERAIIFPVRLPIRQTKILAARMAAVQMKSVKGLNLARG
jgi:hypothetical protein